MADTTNPNVVTEEERALSARIVELDKKSDKTEEESKELDTLKEKRHSSFGEKINKLSNRTKEAEYQFGKKSQEVEDLKTEIAELKTKQTPAKPIVKQETVKHEGKDFYTDAALVSMIDAGQMTQDEAYGHQRTRDRAEDRELLRKERDTENKQTTEQSIRIKDVQEVLTAHPNFSKNLPDGSPNPNFNPEDPLYKTANEIYAEGYAVNPRGLSLALKRAKQILRHTDTSIDNTENLNVHSPSATERQKNKEKETAPTEDEKDTYIRLYRDQTNPATGRVYTEAEAVAKGVNAKKARTQSRRVA